MKPARRLPPPTADERRAAHAWVANELRQAVLPGGSAAVYRAIWTIISRHERLGAKRPDKAGR